MVEIYFMDTSQISAAGAKDLPRSSSGDTSAATEKMSLGSKRALIAAMSGTLIEWYDYALYGAASSLVIAPLFFADVGAGAPFLPLRLSPSVLLHARSVAYLSDTSGIATVDAPRCY